MSEYLSPDLKKLSDEITALESRLREKDELLGRAKDAKERRIVPARLDFERVDIFLRVRGRLPIGAGDGITQELLDEYCKKYEAGELVAGIVPLGYMYDLIKDGRIKPLDEI